mgnify:FL=1
MAILLITPVLLDGEGPVLRHAIQLGSFIAGDIDHGHTAHLQRNLHQPLATVQGSGSTIVTDLWSCS